MKVKELIAKLQEFDKDMTVYVLESISGCDGSIIDYDRTEILTVDKEQYRLTIIEEFQDILVIKG